MRERIKPEPRDRSFISSEDIRYATVGGREGFFIRICLPSYRSLPLSCIENVELSIDGTPVARDNIALVLNGYSHRLDELGDLSKLFWYILDPADLFIATDERLSPEEHLVDGTLVVVEPYMTVGRFSFSYPSRKYLSVAS